MDSASNMKKGYTEWSVCVKVLRVWKHVNFFGLTLEHIVSDNRRTQISVTVMTDELFIYKNYFREDSWYEICNFQVKRESGSVVLSDYGQKIEFGHSTRVRRFDNGPPRLFLLCRQIFDVRTREFESRSLIDVMGTVLRMETLQDNNNDAYQEDLCHVRFELCDTRKDVVIACIAR